MRRQIVLILALLACMPAVVLSTAQVGDRLILNGKNYSVQANPLEEYFETHPDKRPKSNMRSTSNWRGYVATWEVKDGRFVLTDITIELSKKGESGDWTTEEQSVMSEVFPGQKEVMAEWFTGHVVVPNGKLVHYVHMGYASTYDQYILLRVEEGQVTRRWDASRKEFAKFRDEQFAAFKKTEEYRRALEETAKEGSSLSPSETEEFLRQFYSGRYMTMVFDRAPKPPSPRQPE